jgi:hypothetical protein
MFQLDKMVSVVSPQDAGVCIGVNQIIYNNYSLLRTKNCKGLWAGPGSAIIKVFGVHYFPDCLIHVIRRNPAEFDPGPLWDTSSLIPT